MKMRMRHRLCKLRRGSRGVQLIELLMAIFISGYLTAVLGASLAQLISLSTATEQKQVAGIIAQEIIDRLRNTPWASLPANGTYFVRINNLDSGDANPYQNFQVFQRPLQLDDVNLTYTTGNAAVPMPTYMFGSNVQANASVTLATTGMPANTVLATVQISWVAAAAQRPSYTCSAILHEFGTQQNVAE